ncbi:MAG: phytoene desaturase [Anaerolineae bacterium]|nr:phytoene desaturase [Anaerolineae bacterium]
MPFSTSEHPIVIIGAGIGGLSAAIRLAGQGHSVHIYEQQSYVGGKMNEVRADGFRWDTGPSMITMLPAFVDLFAAVGRHLEDYLTFIPIEPLTRYFYPDGVQIDATRDIAHMTAQLARLDERDVDGYLGYLAYAARLHRVAGRAFLYDEPPTLASLASLPISDTFRSMDAAIRSYVHAPHVRQLLGRFATTIGASPYRAPAVLNIFAHMLLNGGVWYPQGGVYAISRALERLAREIGVQLHTGSPVRQIVVEAGIASGVVLADGSQIDASAVITNVDVATVYERMLTAEVIPAHVRQRLFSQAPSASGFIMLLGIEGQHPHLAHHNVFFSNDYPREFTDIFRRGVPPDEPTIYVAITSKHDAQDAPAGCENWFVLVNAPPLSANFDWTVNAPSYRALVLDRLASFGVDVRGQIRSERLLTPLDLQRLTGARRGALYGVGLHQPFALFQRPHNRDPHVERLYHVGGTTHPGGGVAMVILSGALVARLLSQDLL